MGTVTVKVQTQGQPALEFGVAGRQAQGAPQAQCRTRIDVFDAVDLPQGQETQQGAAVKRWPPGECDRFCAGFGFNTFARGLATPLSGVEFVMREKGGIEAALAAKTAG